VDFEQVAHARLAFAVESHCVGASVGVGDCTFELLHDGLGVVNEVDAAKVGVVGLRHLRPGVLQAHHAGTRLRGDGFWNDEGVAKAVVEAHRSVARDLDVLSLILTDGYVIGVVQENVGGLEGRVGEKPTTDKILFAFGRLVFELGHPRELAVADGALHHPTKLVVFGHVALGKDCCHAGVEADGEQHGGGAQGRSTDLARLVSDCQGMQVDYSVERIGLVLTVDPVTQGSEVVTDVQITGGLDTRQDTWLRPRCWNGCRSVVGHVRDDTAGRPAPSVSFVEMVDVATPVYEGPFDLLLQLILKEQVDIYEINLSTIVDAFVRELDRIKVLDLDVATSFLLIAATLVDLKARRLLPNMSDGDLDEEFALWEERDMLLARLLEAKTFKDVASVFDRLAEEADKTFPRVIGPDERFADAVPDMLEGTSLKRFQNAAIKALTPRPKPIVDLFHVDPIKITVADAVSELLEELPRAGRISFRQLTAQFADRIDVIVRFLALLELFKQGAIELDQSERFGDINVVWSMGDDFDSNTILIDAYEG
jgi:segregation and condensation protein A